jgi:diguanylate cyclase (GGDEF)-like protein
MYDLNEAVPLAEGIYWLGAAEGAHRIHCNPYLLTDGEGGILIDPGSPSDFGEVYRKLTSVLPINELEYIVLLHQDPDVASSTPLFEREGFRGSIVTHWRTALITDFYETRSPYYYTDEHGNELSFGEGRSLKFIPAPYLHFPGAVMAYDERSETLFSGDLFGAISEQWSLFAGEDYAEGMKTYHEHYMPSNDILRPVMELLLRTRIAMICPQHGSVIREGVRSYIEILRDLECGALLSPLRRDLVTQGGYAMLIDQVIKRLHAAFGRDAVLDCFRGSAFELDEQTGKPARYQGEAGELWNRLFETIYAYGGSRWLTLLEPLVRKFEQEYGIGRPGIYLGELARQKRKTIGLEETRERLEQVNASLRNNLELTREEMTKDPVTGLYNEDFLVRYLLNIFNEESWKDFTAYFIEIDDMKQLNDTLGEQQGNEIISGVGGLLFRQKREEEYLFRVSGPVFVLVTAEAQREEAERRAEGIRVAVENDRSFLERVTVTIAVIPVQSERLQKNSPTEAMNYLVSRGKSVLRDSLREGGDRVVFDTGEQRRTGLEGRVLVAEYDSFQANLVRDALERLSVEVRVCLNGAEVVKEATEFHPDVIISELFLPESDAFTVKEELEESSRTKEIPFILISHQKNESTVVRALNLGILHYLQKPYMLPELLGIIDTYVQKALRHES